MADLSPELRRALLNNGLQRGLRKLAEGGGLSQQPAAAAAAPTPAIALPASPAPRPSGGGEGGQASVIIHCNSDCMNLTEDGLCGLTSICWNQMAPGSNEGGCSQYKPGAQAELAAPSAPAAPQFSMGAPQADPQADGPA